MRDSERRARRDPRHHSYTDLFVRISEEEDDSYVVQVRLSNGEKSTDAAWGEEIAKTFEAASKLVADIAAEFFILASHIKIELRMHDPKSGTRH